MGQTAFPFESVLDVTPLTLLGNNTASASAAKALTPSQGRALLDVYSAGQTDTLLAAKAAASHTHLQSGKSDAGHTHAYSSLTGIPATFAPSAHNQALHELKAVSETVLDLKDYLGISKQDAEE